MVYFLNILDGFSYFSLSLVFVMVATELFGYSDTAVRPGVVCRSAVCKSAAAFCMLLVPAASCVATSYAASSPGVQQWPALLQAGTLYGLWGVGLSMYQLAFGFIIDALGIKMSFILSCVLTAIGR